MSDVLLHLYRLRHRLGFAGMAGLAVAVGGLVAYLFFVLPAERRAQSSAEQLLHLRMHSETAVRNYRASGTMQHWQNSMGSFRLCKISLIC
jgi:hypothetical protein